MLNIPEDAKRIKVFDLEGKIIHDEFVVSQTTKFGSKWNSGIYLLDVEFSKSSSSFKKLIKI